MALQAYFPTKKASKNKPALIATWDVETADLGGELLAVSYCILHEDGTIAESDIFTGTIDFMFSNLLDRMQAAPKHYWAAHNSQYDWRYFLPWLVKENHALEIFMCTDSKILSVTVDEKIEMRDSFLLFPSALKKFTESFAPEHSKIEIDDITNFNPVDMRHREYAIRDAESLAIALYNYNKFFFEIWGVYPSRTSPASAMKAWLTTLPEIIQPRRNIENFARNAYYGGFVAPLHTGYFKNVRKYDINSSYPASMKLGIPDGAVTYLNGEDYEDGENGFFHCRVKAPADLKIPVIPARAGLGERFTGDIKNILLPTPATPTCYPAGEFETIISTIEIDFARSVGYEIELIRGIVFEDYIFPFTDFVNKCEKLRSEYKGQPVEIIVKLNQNSLYGKFASKRERREVGLMPDDPIGWTPLEGLPEYGFKKEYNDEMLTAPHIAAWITAQSRINLLKSAYAGGAEYVIYCDTDSLVVAEDFDDSKISIGKEYGQFKHECTYEEFRAHAPKVYAGLLCGKWEGACKGIPNPSEKDFAEIFNGIIIEKEFKSLNSLMAAFHKDELTKAKNKKRKSTEAANCEGWLIKPFEKTDFIRI